MKIIVDKITERGDSATDFSVEFLVLLGTAKGLAVLGKAGCKVQYACGKPGELMVETRVFHTYITFSRRTCVNKRNLFSIKLNPQCKNLLKN